MFGKLVGAHCSSTQGIINSLDAGADMLIHCTFFNPDGSYTYDPAVGERIVEAEAWVNPTLHVGTATLWVLEAKQRESGLNHEEAELLETTKRRLEWRLDSCQKLVDIGAKMVSGSDSGWSNYAMGLFQREVTEMTDIGLNNMGAVLSGTSEAAKSIGDGPPGGDAGADQGSGRDCGGGEPAGGHRRAFQHQRGVQGGRSGGLG